MRVRCLHCQEPLEIPDEKDLSGITCSSCGGSFSLVGERTTSYEGPQLRQLGRFKLIEQVGVGAFGAVWKAHDTELDRTVAVKLPRQGLLSAAEAEQFLREARAAAQLKHPHIVSVHEVGRHEDTVYIVSDFVQGATLDDWLTGQQLTHRDAAVLCAKLADALHHAHQAGVIHRDIKPSNIMLDLQGEPHLMDFGLARRQRGEVSMTVEGRILGTPAYMSPEQARGEAHTADRGTDLYSLGVILFRLLTGELPFRGNAQMLIVQILREEPPSPRKLDGRIPRDLETICLKCLEKSPDRRYPTAADLAADLRRYLHGEPIRARPAGQAERLWRWSRRNPAVASLAAVVASLLVVGTIAATLAAFRFSGLAHDALQAKRQTENKAEELETTLYFHRVALAHRELQENNLLKAEELLDECPADRRAWEWFYLKRLWRVEPVSLRGQPGWPHKVAFSPDGRRLASAGEDQTVKIWDAATGQELLVLPDTGEVWCAAFRPPEGRWLVTGDRSGAVTVWDTTTRQVVRTLGQHTATVRDVAFSSDGRHLASASEDTTVKVWDATTGNLLHHLSGHARWAVTVAFSPDGQRLASGSFDTTVKIWDTTTGKLIHTLRGHRDPVVGVAFSPDGRRLASASFDKTVKIWDATTGQETLTLDGHIRQVRGVAFIDDGRRIASVSADKTLKIWNATTGAVVLTLRGQTQELTGLVCSPDGRRLASASGDRTTKIWDATPVDAQAGQEALTFRGHTAGIGGLAFSPDGRRLASSSQDATVRVWDARTGQEELIFRNHAKVVFSVAFSPDGRRIASGSARHAEDEPSNLKVWEVVSGQEVFPPRGTTGETFSVAFSPGNGRWLVTGHFQGAVTVWDATTGQLVRTLGPSRRANVWGLAFSHDGRRLASLGGEGTLAVYDATRWDEQIPQEPLLTFRALNTPEEGISVAFSPDGKLVAPGDENTVNIWDLTTTGEPAPSVPQLTLRGHTAHVLGVAFSPDGRWVASGGEDNTVKLWDATTGGEPIRTFRGHSSMVRRVAFSPDGQRLASASFDKTVKVWDLTQFVKKPE